MSNLIDNELNIDQKHKKERKELQAKIQALKKSVSKDKKRKKEVTDEILRLERELDDRQSNEASEQERTASEGPFEDGEDPRSVKISKAQKRREKKAIEERERARRISEQEVENINGPRNAELNSIKTILKKYNLCLFNVPSDGDCLYKAISHQLGLRDSETISVGDLRQRTAGHIRDNKEDFVPFMSHPETGDMLTDEEFDEYCDKVADTHAWGGQIEVRALSNMLQRPVHIVQASGPELIKQGENFKRDPLVIAYHRHMYSLGEHYNSTRTLPSEAEGDSSPEESI